jgi:hypothetical protein
MKWYEPLNLSVPLMITISCIVIGAIQGYQRSQVVLSAHAAQIQNPSEHRARIQSRYIVGNLIIGGPFAIVLFFSLMPLNRKHRTKNRRTSGTRATD